MLVAEFPQVKLIQNRSNEGFTRPMNQALQASCGRYLLQLNPDTLILPGALDRLVDFLETHPQAGICGPKVLNRDRTLQKPCRRGEPRPLAVFSYFLGLSAIFPKSRLFGEYLMNYMDEDETHTVAGVSGSCMLIRREVTTQIGYLDERFFAYQEDADSVFGPARRVGKFFITRKPKLSITGAWADRASNLTGQFLNGTALITVIIANIWREIIFSCSTGLIIWLWGSNSSLLWV